MKKGKKKKELCTKMDKTKYDLRISHFGFEG